ncbi:MAG: hypothetical protein J0G33_02695 [Afipia felis]|nr:hypothetical protein [Afipia felis]
MLETKIAFDDGRMIVESTQDVEDILENNKRLRSMAQKSDWGRHVASIPNVIMTRWLNEEYERGNTSIRLFGPEMDALVERKLKDPEWAYLRTDSAQVQSFMGFGS